MTKKVQIITDWLGKHNLDFNYGKSAIIKSQVTLSSRVISAEE